MVEITMWAVRVKGTQCYLPRSQRRDERGGSHLEPIDFSLPPEERKVQDRYKREMQIRSYATKQAAVNLLNAWLMGKFRASRGGDMYDGYYEETYVTPQPDRIRENMEIVPITIVLPS